MYGSWGSTGVQRGDQWATTSRVTNNVTGTTTRATRTSEGGAAVSRRGPQGGGFVGTTGGGDVYAGRDGNVYRKQGDSWQQYDNGGWSGAAADAAAARPGRRSAQNRAGQAGTDAATVGQLNRDSAARSDGAQRTPRCRNGAQRLVRLRAAAATGRAAAGRAPAEAADDGVDRLPRRRGGKTPDNPPRGDRRCGLAD